MINHWHNVARKEKKGKKALGKLMYKRVMIEFVNDLGGMSFADFL